MKELSLVSLLTFNTYYNYFYMYLLAQGTQTHTHDYDLQPWLTVE